MKRSLISAAALTLAGALTLAPRLSQAQSNSSWPTFHGSGTRSGTANVTGTTASSAIAHYTLTPGLSDVLPSSPALDSAGNAYIGDGSGNVYKFAPSGSGPVWTEATKGPVSSTPTVSADGKTVYVGSDDGNVYALATSDGHVIWTRQLGSPVRSSPLLSPDGTTLYVTASDGVLASLKTTDGSFNWQFAPGGAMPTSPAESSDGGTLYVVSGDRLYVLPSAGPSSGNQGTSYFLDFAGATTPVIDSNGNIYVGTVKGFLDCFTASGQTCWAHNFQLANFPAITSSPTIVNNLVVFGGGNNIVALSQSSGTQSWQVQTGGPVNSSPAAATGNNEIYVGSGDGNLYAIDSTGKVTFKRFEGGGVNGSPAIAADGSVWSSNNGGDLYHLNAITAPPPPNGTATPGTVTPTATSTPGPTATAGPTNTPTATATVLAPTLSVQAKSSVSPGKTQTVQVTGPANAVVHIRVKYPNGDHQSHSLTLNASGTGTYSYKQGASKITHNKFTATVVAKTGSGTTQAKASATYHIGFGKIDVSAEPRTVAVGKTVDIFVHAAKGTQVVVYLLPPHKKLVSKTGHTGKKGFASIKFKINSGFVAGNKGTVPVLAKIRNKPNIATKTNFKVT